MSKPRMIKIEDSMTLRILEANQKELDCPRLIDGCFVDANEFRLWKTALMSGPAAGKACEY